VYRFLLTPRWWGINLFVVLGVPFCLYMGAWQLGRFEARIDSHQAQQENTAGRQQPAPLAELLPVTQKTWGRLARVTGRYDQERDLLVPDRRVDGEVRDGFYVLSMLRTGGGKALPVVRGWLPGDAAAADRDRIPALPDGEVTVTGVLQVSETQGTTGVSAGGGLPEGQVGVISAASLVNLVPYPVHDAWITLTEGSGSLRPVPPAAPEGTGLDIKAFQNLGYTGEWFVFAGFVVFMWFRLFRREVETQRDLALGLVPVPLPGPVSGPGRDPAEPGPERAPDPRDSDSDQAPDPASKP
jgi:cytochrome oxidase assembly protein ShyY1